MRTTGLDVFDTTVHKTNAWLDDLMSVAGWPDRHTAYLALRSTLHALRDRLTVDEVAQVGAQLPMLVRGFYHEGWDPSHKPLRIRDKEAFLGYIAREVSRNGTINPEIAARAVFTLLAGRISAGEIEDVRHVLPSDLQELWP
jgi:uncharacterized protein (DUF2267 family)